jgi:hypothetical protein
MERDHLAQEVVVDMLWFFMLWIASFLLCWVITFVARGPKARTSSDDVERAAGNNWLAGLAAIRVLWKDMTQPVPDASPLSEELEQSARSHFASRQQTADTDAIRSPLHDVVEPRP